MIVNIGDLRKHLPQLQTLENLLPRQQLQVALRTPPRPWLRTRDKFFWLFVRLLHRN